MPQSADGWGRPLCVGGTSPDALAGEMLANTSRPPREVSVQLVICIAGVKAELPLRAAWSAAGGGEGMLPPGDRRCLRREKTVSAAALRNWPAALTAPAACSAACRVLQALLSSLLVDFSLLLSNVRRHGQSPLNSGIAWVGPHPRIFLCLHSQKIFRFP